MWSRLLASAARVAFYSPTPRRSPSVPASAPTGLPRAALTILHGAANRIATRHQLGWQELDALDAHANLDQVERIDRGWAQKAAALRARLIPTDLDLDPLGKIARRGRRLNSPVASVLRLKSVR